MDAKIEIKEEYILSDDIASQNEGECFTKIVTTKTNSDAVLLDDGCEVEIKSQTPFSDFCSRKETENFTKYVPEQIKSETVTSHNIYDIDVKTEIVEQTLNFVSQNEQEFLPEYPEMKIKTFNTNREMDNKIEIKNESWWLQTDTSSVCEDNQDEDFLSVKSSRLCTAAVYDSSVEILGRDTSCHSGNNSPKYETQESNATEISTVNEPLYSEKYGKCSDREVHSSVLYPKQKNSIDEGKMAYTCNTCMKTYRRSYDLKRHELVHGNIRPYMCKTCDKGFIQLSCLKRHSMIHEGIRPYQCKTCGKSFILSSHLKSHNMIHEAKRPHQCKICDKSFRRLSDLKTHNLIHEGKKPHQCRTCFKSFARLSDYKTHNLIHEPKMPHQCQTCDKSFARLSHLKMHNLVHEGTRPHQCTTCLKSFTRLSDLKKHILIHEGKKPH